MSQDPKNQDSMVLNDLIDDGEDVVLVDNAQAAVAMETDPATANMLIGDVLEPMVLTLEDLFPDENGEVVISTEDGLAISLLTAGEPSETGVADDHVTAAGIDVSGLHYHTFDGGLTIYFASDALVEFSTDLG